MSATELPIAEPAPKAIGAHGLGSGLSTWAARGAIACINAYQRYLSPRKGWSCAHRVRHGGSSCSQFAKQAIAAHGLAAAVPLSQERFAACKEAALQMRAERQKKQGAPQEGQKRKDRGCDADCCDLTPCSSLDMLFDCGPGDSGCIDCSPCN